MFENWVWIAIGLGFLLIGGFLFLLRQMSVQDHISDRQTPVTPPQTTRQDLFPMQTQTPTSTSEFDLPIKKLLSLAGSGMVVVAVILYLAASFNLFPGESVAVIAFVLFFIGTLLRSLTRDKQRK